MLEMMKTGQVVGQEKSRRPHGLGRSQRLKMIFFPTNGPSRCQSQIRTFSHAYLGLYFYYEQQIKRELKGIHTRGCNERLKAKTDGSAHLTYTGFCGELEHLKIETRLIGESFE